MHELRFIRRFIACNKFKIDVYNLKEVQNDRASRSKQTKSETVLRLLTVDRDFMLMIFSC